MILRNLFILALLLPLFVQAQSAPKQTTDSVASRMIYLQNTTFSGLKYVQQGELISVGKNNAKLLAQVQSVPEAHQEIKLATTYRNKAAVFSLVGALGGLGLAMAGGATGQDGLVVAGAGVFSLGTFFSLRLGVKGFNSLNRGVWLYNQEICTP